MTTHTYAVLEVTAATYAEIEGKLCDAGYEHAIHVEDVSEELIDMQGIALKAGDSERLGDALERHLFTDEEIAARKQVAEAHSYADLAASGGIVDAP